MAKSARLSVEPLRTTRGVGAKFRVTKGPSPQPGAVWKFGDVKVAVAAVSGDVVTLAKPSLAKPSSSVMCKRQLAQLTWSSDVEYMAHEVIEYWKSLWLHQRRPDLELVENNLHYFPSLEPFDETIRAAELFVLNKLPVKKSHGLDGFSYAEFRSLGPQLRSMLLSLLNHFTETARWLSQLCTALVSLLAKNDAPMGPSDARPIAVLSSTYRLWSKCVTVKVLQHLLPALPPTLFDSAPGKSALDITWLLQGQLEEALLNGDKVSGVSMDLSKAFNFIPRDPLDRCCQRLGFPDRVRAAYRSFLDELQRFFRVGDSLHGPVASQVGVPEGDPLAVTAMLVVTWFTSSRQQALSGTPLYSYVDNWGYNMRMSRLFWLR